MHLQLFNYLQKAIDSGFLTAIFIVIAALSDTSGRAKGSSAESSSGHVSIK